MIEILDNSLPVDLINLCIQDAEMAKSYGILHGSGDGSYGFKYNWMFFNKEKQQEFTNENLKNLWQEIKKHLPNNIELHRGYINAHTYGVEDVIHSDDPQIKKGLTVIVYLCNDWYPEWFGQTMFFQSLDKHYNEITNSILPKYNRVVIFNKDIPHCVSPLSRKFIGIRLTCMFKVELYD